MKLGDIVRITTGERLGQQGRVIQVFRGWVTFIRPDHVAVQERVEWCEKPTESATGTTLPTVGSHATNPFAALEVE